MKVLVSAYACNPSGSLHLHPGEDLTGWRLVGQIGRFLDCWVITHEYNRQGVEEALKTDPSARAIRFHFFELPVWLKWLYRIEFGQRIYYFLWQFSAWRLARRLNAKIHFDLAHHVTFGNDWIASFIGAFLPVPFVWGPVGGGQRTPRSLLGEYTLYGRFAEAARNAAQWVGRRMLVRRLCLKKTKAFLVCNRETMTRIPDRYKNKVFYFPVNGFSAEDIPADDRIRRNDSAFKVVTAGRLHRLKGFALAVKAFALFAREHPEAEMIIIGKGPEEKTLERLISESGLQDRCRIVDWLPRKEVLAEMRSSDVFLFPSFRDGGGAVVVEAMASGLPVVVLDSGGPGAHVQDAWGIKVAPAEPETVVRQMASVLEKLHADRNLRKRMGDAGRASVRDFYLWDRLGERMMDVYDFVLGGNRPTDLNLSD
ncbi:MAG: glycosyltransferase [Candidatus Aminicenantales bacterium]